MRARITFTVEEVEDDGSAQEVGYGSSSSCASVREAADEVAAILGNELWETAGLHSQDSETNR